MASLRATPLARDTRNAFAPTLAAAAVVIVAEFVAVVAAPHCAIDCPRTTVQAAGRMQAAAILIASDPTRSTSPSASVEKPVSAESVMASAPLLRAASRVKEMRGGVEGLLYDTHVALVPATTALREADGIHRVMTHVDVVRPEPVSAATVHAGDTVTTSPDVRSPSWRSALAGSALKGVSAVRVTVVATVVSALATVNVTGAAETTCTASVAAAAAEAAEPGAESWARQLLADAMNVAA
mmetsp:Transcript_60615/g.126911  ORF Transcript_60615/g.126911 Transcript_60615/m.126911 type:complete len:240 (-) Transcript_60615:2686-3405(-)